MLSFASKKHFCHTKLAAGCISSNIRPDKQPFPSIDALTYLTVYHKNSINVYMGLRLIVVLQEI